MRVSFYRRPSQVVALLNATGHFASSKRDKLNRREAQTKAALLYLGRNAYPVASGVTMSFKGT